MKSDKFTTVSLSLMRNDEACTRAWYKKHRQKAKQHSECQHVSKCTLMFFKKQRFIDHYGFKTHHEVAKKMKRNKHYLQIPASGSCADTSIEMHIILGSPLSV